MTKYYSKDLRAVVTKQKYLGSRGLRFKVRFQKRWYSFFWKQIDIVYYKVYDYWNPFNIDVGPILGTYQYGEDYEVWKPEKFDLYRLIDQRWLGIIDREEKGKAILEKFKDIC